MMCYLDGVLRTMLRSRPSPSGPGTSSGPSSDTLRTYQLGYDEAHGGCITSNGATDGTHNSTGTLRPLTSRGPCRVLEDASNVRDEVGHLLATKSRGDDDLDRVGILELASDSTNVLLVRRLAEAAPGLVATVRVLVELRHREQPLAPTTGLLTILDSTHNIQPFVRGEGTLRLPLYRTLEAPSKFPRYRSCKVPQVRAILSSWPQDLEVHDGPVRPSR